MATVNEESTIKQNYRMNLFFVEISSFVLLPNSMSELIHNRCTRKLIVKTMAAFVLEQLRLCFHVLIRYFVSSSIYSPLKIHDDT